MLGDVDAHAESIVFAVVVDDALLDVDVGDGVGLDGVKLEVGGGGVEVGGGNVEALEDLFLRLFLIVGWGGRGGGTA